MLKDRTVVLEVGEHSHRFYERSYECTRVLDLHEQGQGKALFLVRFNPQQRLLEQLAQVLRKCFSDPLPQTLLGVTFLGTIQSTVL